MNSLKNATVLMFQILSEVKKDGIHQIEILSTFAMDSQPKRPLQYQWTWTESLNVDYTKQVPYHASNDAWCLAPENAIRFKIPANLSAFYVHKGKWGTHLRDLLIEVDSDGYGQPCKEIVMISPEERRRRQQPNRKSIGSQINKNWEHEAKRQSDKRKDKFDKIRTVFRIVKEQVGAKKAIEEFRKAGML